jgi:hypothetical protein
MSSAATPVSWPPRPMKERLAEGRSQSAVLVTGWSCWYLQSSAWLRLGYCFIHDAPARPLIEREARSWLRADGPVAVAVDDLHWADSASVLLLHRLGRVAGRLPLLLADSAGTRRPPDPMSRRHPWPAPALSAGS